MTRFELWSLVMSGLSVAASVGGFLFLLVQLRDTNASLETGIYTSMSEWTYDINKAMIEHADLRKYFYDGQDITTDHPDFQRAEAVADYVLSFHDSNLFVGAYFAGGAPGAGWTNAVYDAFGTSPLLRRTIEKRVRWYPRDGPLWGVYERWQRDHPAASTAAAPKR